MAFLMYPIRIEDDDEVSSPNIAAACDSAAPLLASNLKFNFKQIKWH